MRRLILGISVVAVFGVLTACTSLTVQLNVNQGVANGNAVSNFNVNTVPVNVNAVANVNVTPVTANTNTQAVAALVDPLDRRAERVTKKSFGTYITPKTSPIQPERFTGYHTGLDYETFASEAKVDVPVVAACTGKVRARQTVSGYGGVLVQQCVVAGQTVTALYGHLRLSSINVKVGAELKAGTQFAALGTGYSSETNGERKHLHFSLHKGTTINWKGYVSTKGTLVDWLDPQKYL
ncbi:MAG: M23 family metallopeptidase [bacterium]|nr:M23 family metallopeptidase [bacterium]